MLNLELWHNLSALFLRKQLKLKSLYSQTCSNDHLYQMTTRPRRPTLSPTKPIPIQSLLYKTTTYLTLPDTTFFVPQMKKNLSKTPLKTFNHRKKDTIYIKQTSPGYIYSFATLRPSAPSALKGNSKFAYKNIQSGTENQMLPATKGNLNFVSSRKQSVTLDCKLG